MIPVRQAKPSTPPSRDQSTTNKTVFGLPAVFLGLLLPLGLIGNAALGFCVCDEQILGKEYCDSFLAMCGEYDHRLKTVLKQVDNYGWDVCNKSPNTIYAAYASAYEGYSYTRKGWYEVSPGSSCRRILTESMTDKNYYVSILKSDGSTLTRQEKRFCMWPLESNGQIEATYSTCRKLTEGNKSFQKMEKGNGFITTVR